MGIRQKFWAGIGGLLFVLLLAGSSAVWVITRSNRAVETLFSNNYSSVAYMHELAEALDGIDGRLQASLGKDSGTPVLPPGDESKVSEEIDAEGRRLTEEGERELFEKLKATWLQLQKDYPLLSSRTGSESRRLLYETRLRPEIRGIKELAWQISDLNLRSMARFQGRGRRASDTAQSWMILLMLSGSFLAVILMTMLGRAILRPIQLLTDSAHEIERGNLDLVIADESDDELGQLAKAFNSMALRLKAFQRGLRAKLLRTQKTTQMAIDSFSDAVAILGPKGQVELCNKAAGLLFGLQAGQGLAKTPLARLEALIPRVLEKGQAYEPRGYAEAFQVFQKGREKFVLPRLVPVLDKQEEVVGITLVLADVTGLRKMDEMKSGLLATVSHELRTPLTSLRMATHLLLEKTLGPLKPRQEELLNTARDDSERLHEILEELLDLGRLEAGGGGPQFSERPADRLLLDALELASHDFRSKGIGLECQLPPGLPSLRVDPQRINYVFSNLLGNALKYSPPGSLVLAGASLEKEGVRFWVQDQGPGIPEAYKSRIFEKFFRVPGPEAGPGIGLGLAIAKEIVEMHGGFVRVEDAGEKGSLFSFVLPLEASGLPQA